MGDCQLLSPAVHMRALAILGPGTHDKNLLLLNRAGLDVELWSNDSAESRGDLAVVLGGDGTIHRFLPQLLRAKLPVLLMPSGSGNDLARALNVPSPKISSDLALAFVRGTAKIREIDLGIITDSQGNETHFCCVGGVGLDAIAAKFANQMPRWLRARGGYLLGAAWALLQAPSLRLRISADSREIFVQQNSCLFSFANTASFGGGLRIAPDAQLDDGQLDCVLAEEMGRIKLLRSAIALLKRRHLKLKEVTSFQAEQLRIECDAPTWVYADGERVCLTPVEVRIVARALRMFSGT